MKSDNDFSTFLSLCVCVCFCKQGLIGVLGVFLCCLFAEMECIGITAGTTCQITCCKLCQTLQDPMAQT